MALTRSNYSRMRVERMSNRSRIVVVTSVLSFQAKRISLNAKLPARLDLSSNKDRSETIEKDQVISS